MATLTSHLDDQGRECPGSGYDGLKGSKSKFMSSEQESFDAKRRRFQATPLCSVFPKPPGQRKKTHHFDPDRPLLVSPPCPALPSPQDHCVEFSPCFTAKRRRFLSTPTSVTYRCPGRPPDKG